MYWPRTRPEMLRGHAALKLVSGFICPLVSSSVLPFVARWFSDQRRDEFRLLATKYGTATEVLPALTVVRGFAATAKHHVDNDLFAANLAFRVANRNCSVALEKVDTFDASQHTVVK